jgi:T5SS/PEP-CTERM-associated repeat protein
MRRLRSIAGCSSIALLLLAAPLHAADLTWTNAAGGFAGTAANWNPAQQPTLLDSLIFSLPSTYTVTFGVNADSTRSMFLDEGDLTFRFPADHLVNGHLRIGKTAFLTPSLVIESGHTEVRGGLRVGEGANTDAALAVTGGATDLSLPSTSQLHLVGITMGSGSLDVLDGGSVSAASGTLIGNGNGTGALRVIGESAVSPFRRSTLAMTDPGDFMSIAQAATGTGEVRDGALLDVRGNFNIAHLANSAGALEVGGLGAHDSAEVDVGALLRVGTAATGAGRLSIEAFGSVDVGSGTTVGDGSGEDTLEVFEGGRLTTRSLTMPSPSTDLRFHGGLIQVRGGLLDLSDDPLVLNSVIGTPTLELLDGATAVLAPLSGPGVLVGDDGVGTLRVLTGSDVTLSGQNTVIADESGSTGVLEVNGAGSSLTSDSPVIVGRAGLAQLSVRGGASFSADDLRVATQAGGIGFAAFQDAGTSGHVAGRLEVSGLASGASGASGVVSVKNGAALWLDDPAAAGDVWPTGTLSVETGAVLHLAGSLAQRGTLQFLGGNSSGGRIRPIESGLLTGFGDVSSSIDSDADSSASIVATGALLLGRSDAAGGFEFMGSLSAGANPVTLRDADSATVADVDLQNGTLTFQNAEGVVVAGKTLGGTGTVLGDVTLRGQAIATATNGLSFAGRVIGSGQGMTGTRFRFLPGSRFEGRGAVIASVVVDSGAVVAPSFDLDLGGSLANRVTIDGLLSVGPYEVIAEAGDTVRVGGTIAIDGGFFQVPGNVPLLLRPIARLEGHGTADANTVLGGTLDPGTGTRQMEVGSLRVRPEGRVVVELGSHAAAQYDTVLVAGQAILDGTLDVRRVAGFAAAPGDSFVVMTMASRAGAFTTITLDGQSSAGQIQAVYTPTAVILVVLPGIVDASGDPVTHGSPAPLRLTGRGTPGRTPSLELALPEAAAARVELFDVSGRRVGVLHDGPLAAGLHRFDTADAIGGAGLFFARVEVVGRAGRELRSARLVRLP